MVDIIFFAFTLIFVATAFFRGFVKEIFALVAWILAFVGSYLLTPYLAKVFNVYSHNQMVADVSARSILFIVIFFIFTFSTSNLCSELKEKMPRAFDRSLGVFFGLIKTLIIFGSVYAVAINSFGLLAGKPVDESSPQFPSFLKEAKCHDILKGSAEVLNPAVKLFFDSVVKNFDQVVPKQKDDLGAKIEELVGGKKKATTTESDDALPATDGVVPDSGYNKKDIEKMNNLIEIIRK